MRRIVVMSILTVAAMFMAGCIDMKVVTTVNEDGSGSWAFGIHLDEELSEQGGGEMETEGLLGEEESVTDEETGITFRSETVEEEDGKTWMFVIADIPEAELWSELEGAFTRIDEQMSEEEDAELEEGDLGAEDVTETLEIIPEVMIDGDVVRVEFTSEVSPSEMMAGDEEASDSEDGGFGDLASMGIDIADFFNFSYEVNLPGTVTDTNGLLDPNTGTLIYELDFSSEEPLEFYAESTQ